MIRTAIATLTTVTLAAGLCAGSAAAQEAEPVARTRIGAGVQLTPDFPGAKDKSFRPMFDFNRADPGEQFRFTSADESFGPALVRTENFSFGPSLALQGKRSRSDTDGLLPKVGRTFEAGGFAQADFNSFRLRGEVRKGLGGHKGVVANLSADYVARDRDNWLFAVGPRVRMVNGRYNRAYYGVDPIYAVPGMPAYRPKGGVEAVGAAANGLYALTPEWGLLGYVRYDRLVGDAGKSPVVRNLGDRDQWSGGVAVTYTFGD